MTSLVGKDQLASIFYFVIFSSRTSFFKLQDVFPECFYYRDQSPQIEPLVCLQEDRSCTAGKGCMGVLVKRLHALFEEVCFSADMIVLYFRKRNFHGLGAGVFDRGLEAPRVITMNPSAWGMIKDRGNVYQFHPSGDFFLTGSAAPPKEVKKDKDQLLE